MMRGHGDDGRAFVAAYPAEARRLEAEGLYRRADEHEARVERILEILARDRPAGIERDRQVDVRLS